MFSNLINTVLTSGCVCGVVLFFTQSPRVRSYIDKWNCIHDVCALSNTGVRVYTSAVSIIARYPYEILKRKIVRVKTTPFVVVPYEIGGVKYKMMTKRRTGPCKILTITDQDGVDVTDIVRPYMGPVYNWHGHDFKPQDMGYKQLTFLTSDFEEEVFS